MISPAVSLSYVAGNAILYIIYAVLLCCLVYVLLVKFMFKYVGDIPLSHPPSPIYIYICVCVCV